MVRKLFLATGVVLALSSAAWAQTTVPGGMAPGAGGPIGIGPDTSPRVPGTSNPSDPRRSPSGTRALGTTGGVDAGSALGGATDPNTGSSALGSGPMGAGSIGSGSGVTGSGALTGGANAPLPGSSGMRSSGSLGGAAGAGAGAAPGAGVGGAAGAAGSGGAGAGGGAR
jgi:hypothetical protein